MIQLTRNHLRLGGGVSRRNLLVAGSVGGLTLPALLAGQALGAPAGAFGRAKSCLLIYLTGGPPQHETWDPKPEASAEIRGPFGVLNSSLDGLQVGELMPALARRAHHYSVIRTMATDVNAHTGSGYWVLTGHPHTNRQGESIPPDSNDWPSLASVVKHCRPGDRGLPPVVTLPEAIKNNPGIVVAGQNAGFLSPSSDPFLVEGDPAAADFQVSGLSPQPGVPLDRLHHRRGLLDRVNSGIDAALQRFPFEKSDSAFQQAFDLVTSAAARRAFDLQREPAALRAKYGSHKFGQSCLLARRLLESGVRLVTVHWPREPGDFSIGNPVWDSHSDHAGRLKNHLMPPMDQGISALLDDLMARGLLDETLVVCTGEFGRTPRFNPNGGRDHWGHTFCAMLAGGGIRAGQVLGQTDRLGAFPESDRIEPDRLHATIYHCLGISTEAEIVDRSGRPFRLCQADPIQELLI